MRVETSLILLNTFLLVIFGVFCDNDRIIDTKNGQVRGRRETSLRNKVNFYSFRGIPYAKPPLGDLRFKVSFLCVWKNREIFEEIYQMTSEEMAIDFGRI